MMIDSMLLMMSVPFFLMVRGLWVRPPVSAPAKIANHGEAAALVQAERQDGAVGRVVHHAGIGGGLAGRVDQQAFLHLHLLVVGHAHLAHRHLAGGEVEHDRLLALARHGGAVGIGGEARLGAAERRDQRLVAMHVHPVRAHHAGACALLAPVADASDVVGIGKADDADAVLFSAVDADIHGLLGDDLTVARAAVDHNYGAIIARNLCMMVTDTSARRGVLDIGRDHADAVAVVAEQVGQHQMVGDQAGLLVRAAVGPADRHGESVQTIGLYTYFAHRALPSAMPLPPVFLFRAARFPVTGALSTAKRRQSDCNEKVALFSASLGDKTGPRGPW